MTVEAPEAMLGNPAGCMRYRIGRNVVRHDMISWEPEVAG